VGVEDIYARRCDPWCFAAAATIGPAAVPSGRRPWPPGPGGPALGRPSSPPLATGRAPRRPRAPGGHLHERPRTTAAAGDPIADLPVATTRPYCGPADGSWPAPVGAGW